MIPTNILILIGLALVLLAFQVVLSLMDSKVPGLVMPILCGVAGLAFSIYGISMMPPGTAKDIINCVFSILVYLLPAALMLVIFFLCRKRVRARHNKQKQQNNQ